MTFFNQATAFRSFFSGFGNLATPKFRIRACAISIAVGPTPAKAGRNPTITRGLDLLAYFYRVFRARMMPIYQKVYNLLKSIYY
jgi:hypothetical protein